MLTTLVHGLIDAGLSSGNTLLGMVSRQLSHKREMDKERETTKRMKYTASIKDIQAARKDKSIFTAIERYTLVLFFGGAVSVLLFISALMHIPINVPIEHHRGFFGSLFFGAEYTTIATVQGMYVMPWLEYPIISIVSFLFGRGSK